MTMMALARAGDNVLLPTPWYFNHEMTLTMLGIEARPLPCDPAGRLRARCRDGRGADRRADPRHRAGDAEQPDRRGLSARDHRRLRRALRRGAASGWCSTRPIAISCPPALTRRTRSSPTSGWRDSVIGLYSFSKAYAVPGWRLGAITAGEPSSREIAQGAGLRPDLPGPRRAGARSPGASTASATGARRNRAEINARAALFRARDGAAERLAGALGRRLFRLCRASLRGRAGRRGRARPGRGSAACSPCPAPISAPGRSTHLRIAIANVAAERIGELGERLHGFSL